MTNRVKRFLWAVHSRVPGNVLALRAYYAVKYGGSQKVFQSKYARNAWGDSETVSGWGSTLKYTELLRTALPALFREYSVHRFLDAPCGDYNWFAHVERPPGFSYLGADIVPELVAKNNQLYS